MSQNHCRKVVEINRAGSTKFIPTSGQKKKNYINEGQESGFELRIQQKEQEKLLSNCFPQSQWTITSTEF